MHYLGIEANRIRVVPLAHDSSIFHPIDRNVVDTIRKCYALGENFFIAVGSGDPRKNMGIIPLALQAARLNIPLVVVGWSGWTQKRTCQCRVIPLGYVPNEDLAGLYSGATALIYPSLYEGFGLPILEAMACGCPVICSRAASIPEVAGDAAVYLDDPKDWEGLGKLLQQVASDKPLRERLSHKGLARAALFSWEKTARQTLNVFEKIL